MAEYRKPPIVKGAVYFYTQRVDGRPFVNCMMYSLCSVLRWVGYDVPKDYGMTLREASGVPVQPKLGTSTADTKRALAKALPTATLLHAALADGDLWRLLPRVGRRNRAKAVVRITARMHHLPRRLRRWCGYEWVGTHAMALAWARTCDGSVTDDAHAGHWQRQEVWLMDPMGKPSKGYAGEWVGWDELAPALVRNSEGGIRCSWGVKSTAA